MAFKDYMNETKGELKHVSWPSRDQAINYTIIVVIVSVVTALFLSFFDLGFVYLLEQFILKS